MIKAATALVAACLLAVPAIASAHPAEAGSIRISTVGIDFANPGQVETFRARVDAAIARVCNLTTSFSASLAPDRQCQRDVADKLTPTLTRLIEGRANRMVAVN